MLLLGRISATGILLADLVGADSLVAADSTAVSVLHQRARIVRASFAGRVFFRRKIQSHFTARCCRYGESRASSQSVLGYLVRGSDSLAGFVGRHSAGSSR